MLDSASNAADKGQGQYFTPIAVAQRLAAALPQHRPVIVDLTAGAGHLVHAAASPTTTSHLLCADIQAQPHMTDEDRKLIERTRHLQTVRIHQDLCRLYPILREVGWRADLFTLNPPWRLFWYRDHLTALAESECPAVAAAFAGVETGTGVPRACIDSTIATLLIALDRCSANGEGYLLANHSTIERLIFAPGAPHGDLSRHIWLRVIVPGNVCLCPPNPESDNPAVREDFQTEILYFARSHRSGPQLILRDLEGITARQRLHNFGGMIGRFSEREDTAELWATVNQELRDRAASRPNWNLWLEHGVIRTNLTRFDEARSELDQHEANRLHKLNGKSPLQLVLLRSERLELDHVARSAGWRVQPELLQAIEDAKAQYNAVRAPLYPLSEIQRLGYLDEQDTITCKIDLTGPDGTCFRAGQTYPIRTQTAPVTRTVLRPEAHGELDELELTGQELVICIRASDGSEVTFMEARLKDDKTTKIPVVRRSGLGDKAPAARPDEPPIDFTLQQLCAHFVIPEVPDVASCHPEAYQKNLAILDAIIAATARFRTDPFELRLFQAQDLARSGLHPGLILSWDTGLGKTIASLLYPLLKVGWHLRQPEAKDCELVPNSAVLIIAPGDLHQAFTIEAREKFGIRLVPLDSQETFMRLTRGADGVTPRMTPDGRPLLPPAFYLTSYTQLATNGVQKLPDTEKWAPRALLAHCALPLGAHEGNHRRAEPLPDSYASVCEFFAWREKIWADAYDLIGIKPEASLADLADLVSMKESEIASWTDAKAAAAELRRIHQAQGILENLFGVRHHAPFANLTAKQQDFVIREFLARKMAEYAGGNGLVAHYPIHADGSFDRPLRAEAAAQRREDDTRSTYKIKCCAYPSLADLSYRAFATVVVDEGVKLKADATLIGLGVRSMEPEYRCVLTATPVKNRLPDIFWLAHWACGAHREACPRWPYREDSRERQTFANTFMVSEKNLSAIARAKAQKQRVPDSRFTKLRPEVCSVHKLWKLLAPVVLRRRKQDADVDLVPKQRLVVRCKMGTAQKDVTAYHLQAHYRDSLGNPAIGARLQALRAAAADPTSDNLVEVPGGATKPCECAKFRTESEREEPSPYEIDSATLHAKEFCPVCQGRATVDLPHRSPHPYTPKLHAVLKIVQEVLERGEQVMIGAAFQNPLDTLGDYLRQAEIPFMSLDGRVNQKKRGELIQQFKHGLPAINQPLSTINLPPPVALCGVESMAEGHNLDTVQNIILFSYSWAYDKFKQFIDRIYRLTSKLGIRVYVVLCDGSIDAKLESLIQEKGDAAELVLDGKLLGENAEEVNLAQLLNAAYAEFAVESDTLDEVTLQRNEWPMLRTALQRVMNHWRVPAAMEAPVSTPAYGKVDSGESPDTWFSILESVLALPIEALPTQLVH